MLNKCTFNEIDVNSKFNWKNKNFIKNSRNLAKCQITKQEFMFNGNEIVSKEENSNNFNPDYQSIIDFYSTPITDII